MSFDKLSAAYDGGTLTLCILCLLPGTCLLQAISAHSLWLGHLRETWAVMSLLRDTRTAAARGVLGRLLAASLQDPLVLSHHPAALGAYFRLLSFGLTYAADCMAARPPDGGHSGGDSDDVLLLTDRVLRAVRLLRHSQ